MTPERLSTHSRPVNALAARELAASSTTDACPFTQPPLHPEAPSVIAQRVPKFRDLTGEKFGSAAVVGLMQARSGRMGEWLWVVRCQCGRHDTVAGKTVLRHQMLQQRLGAAHRGWKCTHCYCIGPNVEVSRRDEH